MTHSPIRSARHDRGWSQARLVNELLRAARSHGISVMTEGALTTALSRWENGHVRPARENRHLLRLVLSIDLEDDHERSASELPVRSLTLAQVEGQAGILSAIRRSDRQGLSFIINPQLDTYATGLRESLRAGGPLDVRVSLSSLLADADALVAWQLLDLGQPDAELSRYETAERHAKNAEDPHLIAHARAGRAVALIDLGRSVEAYELMCGTVRQAERKVAPVFWAWLLAARAEAAAAAGDVRGCRDSVTAAFDALPTSGWADPSLPYVTLDPVHLQRWAGHALSMIGERSALDMLGEAATAMPEDFVRARGSLHTDLADCHALLGNASDADRERATALDLVRESGSRRQRRRLGNRAAA